MTAFLIMMPEVSSCKLLFIPLTNRFVIGKRYGCLLTIFIITLYLTEPSGKVDTLFLSLKNVKVQVY